MSFRTWPEYGLVISVQAEFSADPARVIREVSEPTMIAIVPYLKGDTGDAASQFIHTQAVASDTWTVNHNKGYRPNALVYSIGWVEIETVVVHVSENQLVIHLNTPQTGYVLC